MFNNSLIFLPMVTEGYVMDKQSCDILGQYYVTMGPSWCAAQLGISYRACVLRARRLGVGSRRAYKRIEIEKHIRDNYQKTSGRECAVELGIAAQSVRQIASRIGVEKKTSSSQYSKSVNALFFDSWTKESAYILGFLYADGSIRERGTVLFFQNDTSLLEKIRKIMGIKTEIRNHGERCHVLSFNNCYMACRLREIGVREAKSFGNMVFPNGLPDVLYGHFFRGFFDGDGSVGVYGEWNNLRLSLYAQKDFVERMYLDTNRIVGVHGGGVRRATSAKREDFFTCSWGAEDDVRKIYEWMYRDSGDLYLTRKKDVFERKWSMMAA